jgi:hypothetical protein
MTDEYAKHPDVISAGREHHDAGAVADHETPARIEPDLPMGSLRGGTIHV